MGVRRLWRFIFGRVALPRPYDCNACGKTRHTISNSEALDAQLDGRVDCRRCGEATTPRPMAGDPPIRLWGQP